MKKGTAWWESLWWVLDKVPKACQPMISLSMPFMLL